MPSPGPGVADPATFQLKRVYEARDATDGVRVLIDGLWPRGIRKDDPRVDQWMKALAPSTALRKSFDHREENWPRFLADYHQELMAKDSEIQQLKALLEEGPVTLVYATRERRFNNAVALMAFLES